MLQSVIQQALRYRLLVVLLSMVAMVYGAFVASEMPIDVFPDLDRPRVILLTECPGMATEEVETLITQPIEVALLGASGVQAVRSQTTAGLNVVYIEFDWSTEVRAARQTVQERIATLNDVLPSGIRPQMAPPASIMGQMMVAGLFQQPGPNRGELMPIPDTEYLLERCAAEPGESERFFVWKPETSREHRDWKPVAARLSSPWVREESERLGRKIAMEIEGKEVTIDLPNPEQRRMQLRSLADWVIRPRLLKVPGVAEVFVLGGDRKQYQVLLDPAALHEYGLALSDVEQSLRESNINTSGGYAIEGEIERPIRILGRLGPDPDSVIQDLKQIPVRMDQKRPVLLGQVARIIEGVELKRGDASVNGRPAVVFTIVKQSHVDTRTLTDQLEKAFGEVQSTLPLNLSIHSELFRLKNFIDRGVYNVGEALWIGAVLVLIILLIFLMSIRTTLITLSAIPLSLVITALVFRLIGYLTGTELTINVMTLGGIAVAMGELVDDAIVDVENIFRRLRENRQQLAPKPAIQVVYDASVEIRSSIVFGTAVVVLVFLPLFALSGIEGRLFAPLGIAYIVSILASLFVSMTVTPVLSYYLLRDVSHQSSGDGLVLRHLKIVAKQLVAISMAIPIPLLSVTWLMVGLAVWQVVHMGKDFLPAFDEGSIQINVTLPPGSSLQASNQVSDWIDQCLLRYQRSSENPDGEILHFVRRTGRAALDEHANPVNMGEYILSMNPLSHRERGDVIQELLSEVRKHAPGVDVEVEQPLAHLISHMISGVYAQIAIKVHGDDIETLRAVSDRIKLELEGIEGVTPPVVEAIQQSDELHIRLRSEDLAFYGLTRSYVARILQTALQGEVVSQVLEGQRRYDLLVRLEENYRTDYSQLGRLRIDLPGQSGQVELRELAEIGMGVGPNAVNRENARRRMVIRCNTQGRDLDSTVREIEATISQKVDLPPGYFLEFGGQFESQKRATLLILALAMVSIVGIFVVLSILFPSVRIVLQILNALPTAFIGGVLALMLTNQSLTVASLVGFISLGGIAVRNGILLVTHYIHLMKQEGEGFTESMVLRGSLERLAPVLMTALTAGIGLIPLVVGGQEPGREILYPVASVILGGLVTSTFCEFLIHPGLFWHFSGKDAQRLVEST